MTVTAEARLTTDSPDRYAKQLANHAAHMGAQSHWSPPEGVVEFPQGGTCRFRVGPSELVLIVQAPDAEVLATIQAILTADLERFGQRQNLRVTWS